ALATLAAYDLAMRGYSVECVTFGSPRVGDEDFKEAYAGKVKRTARFINKFDPVPRLPWNARDEERSSDADAVHLACGTFLALPQLGLQYGAYGEEACGSFVHVCPATQLDVGVYGSLKFWGEVGMYGQLFWDLKDGKLDANEIASQIVDIYNSQDLAAALEGTGKAVSEVEREASQAKAFLECLAEALLPHALGFYKSNLDMCFSGMGKFQPAEMLKVAQRYKDVVWRLGSSLIDTKPEVEQVQPVGHIFRKIDFKMMSSLFPGVSAQAAGVAMVASGFAGT
ncbi:unnamed protein product, partial [Symbiodinium necroappetens]